MPGNIFAITLHPTFEQKVSNFPDDVYAFNNFDNLTLLMKTLLGHAGTGQLSMLQTAARLNQQTIEFSDLDNILGLVVGLQRAASEVYSFATNPFIDQLNYTQWQEVNRKDASYRERLIGAAEALQLGATVWGIQVLAEAVTGVPFTVVESWRTPNLGRFSSLSTEVVLVPILDTGATVTLTQDETNQLLRTIGSLLPANFVASVAKSPKTLLTNVTASWVSAKEGYSENFFMNRVVQANGVNTSSVQQPGSSTRYWVQNSTPTTAPVFAHLQSQEKIIDSTRNISSVTVSGSAVANPQDSLANPQLTVGATVYGGQ